MRGFLPDCFTVAWGWSHYFSPSIQENELTCCSIPAAIGAIFSNTRQQTNNRVRNKKHEGKFAMSIVTSTDKSVFGALFVAQRRLRSAVSN